MKRLLCTITTLFFIVSLFFANPYLVLADEGEAVHGLEAEVNGYHITLTNENEWAKGENTVIVTIADEMGMPVTDTEVEIVIAPKAAGHAAAQTEAHSESEAGSHVVEPPESDSMPGMDMGNNQSHDSMPGMDMGEATEEVVAHEEANHGEREASDPIAMRAAEEHGMYVAETHLAASGEHEVRVMFHVNGEMIEAAFIVQIPGSTSKTVVLWSFALVNMALIGSAGFIKKQTIPVKGAK